MVLANYLPRRRPDAESFAFQVEMLQVAAAADRPAEISANWVTQSAYARHKHNSRPELNLSSSLHPPCPTRRRATDHQ